MLNLVTFNTIVGFSDLAGHQQDITLGVLVKAILALASYKLFDTLVF